MTTTTASTRQTAWRRLGTHLTTSDQGMSRDEMINAAGLNWTVEQWPITSAVPTPEGVDTLEFPRRLATVRRNPDGSVAPLGITGDGFTVLQNLEMFDTLAAIADVADARFESAGWTRGGAQVFAALTLPREVQIGGRDAVGMTLLSRNGHDGSAAFTVAATPVRIRCTNMLRRTFRTAAHTISVKHTQNSTLRIQQAREALRLSFAYEDEWTRWAESLISEPMSRREFGDLVDVLLPLPDREATGRVAERHRERNHEVKLMWQASTQENITDTRWGAWNAISEWDEWVAPVRGKNPDESRAVRQIERGVGSLTERAAALLSR